MGFYVAIPTSNIGNGPLKFCYEGNSTVFSYSSYRQNIRVFAIKDGTECTCNVYYISSVYTISDFNVAADGGFFAHDSSYNNNFTPPQYLPPGTKIWTIGYHVIQDSRVSPEGQFNCPVNFGENGGTNGVHCILLNIPTTVSGSFNTWQTYNGGYRIFVNNNNSATKIPFTVTTNHIYQINFEVFAESGGDGIMISTNSGLTYDEIYMGSSVSNTPGYVAHCDGVIPSRSGGGQKATKTVKWTATTSPIWLYFKTDIGVLQGPGNQTYYSYGYVKITDLGASTTPVTITFNANGGSGGTTSLSGYAGQTPNDINNGYISRPTRSGTNGNFEFLGYYSATSGGTQYYNQYGMGLSSVTFTGNIILYAHWKNRVVYPTSLSLDVWADYGNDITSTTTTSSSYPRHFDLNDSYSWYCNAGTVTESNLTSGFGLVDYGKKIIIPSGKGSMDISFKLTSPSSTGNYEGETKTVTIKLNVKQNYVSDSGEEELIIDQKQPVPASITILSKADLSLYFDVSRYGTYEQYANGYMSSTGTSNLPTSFWLYGDMNICWISESGSYMYFDDLGTTCCESSVKKFNNYNGVTYTSCYIYANYTADYVDPEGVVDTEVYYGEKHDYVRGSNYATLTVNAVNTMALNASTPITVRADFTSGSSIADVTGDCVITTEPTGIIEIV